MAKLWQLNYGYEVEISKGVNKGKKGYVIGITEKGKIEINLSKEPYSGKHDIEVDPSKLEVLVIGNPHDICDLKYEVAPKKQTEFTVAKLKVVNENPEIIIKYPEYFTVLEDDDWVEQAEKRLEELKYGKIGKYYHRILNALNRTSKEEINQGVKSLVEKLKEEDKKH